MRKYKIFYPWWSFKNGDDIRGPKSVHLTNIRPPFPIKVLISSYLRGDPIIVSVLFSSKLINKNEIKSEYINSEYTFMYALGSWTTLDKINPCTQLTVGYHISMHSEWMNTTLSRFMHNHDTIVKARSSKSKLCPTRFERLQGLFIVYITVGSTIHPKPLNT